jgi:hypothetical protein
LKSSYDVKEEQQEISLRMPVPQCFVGVVHQFKELLIDGLAVRTSERDDCIRIDQVVSVLNVISTEGKEYIVGKEYRLKAPFLEYPLDSRELEIYVGSNLSSRIQCFQVKHLKKYVWLQICGLSSFALSPRTGT